MKQYLVWSSVQSVLTIMGIILFGCLPFLFFDMEANKEVFYMINQKKINSASYLTDSLIFNWEGYVDQLLLTVKEVTRFWELKYVTSTGVEVSAYPEVWVTYKKSLAYFLGGLGVALIVSVFLVHGMMILGQRTRKAGKSILTLMESLPDVFYIIAVQLGVIWFFRKTNVVLFNTSYSFGDEAVFFPIFILSLLPTVYLVKYLLLAFEEQDDELYVELAKGKGVSRFKIVSVHIFRNALSALKNHFKSIFWIMLSNWLMLEIFMDFHGFMQFLLDHGPLNPSLFVLSVLMIFLPYMFIGTIINAIVLSLGKGRWVG